MNRSKQRRRDRRRAKREAFFAQQGRQLSTPRTMAHNIAMDAVHADMERRPHRARLWVWIGGLCFLAAVAGLIANLLMR